MDKSGDVGQRSEPDGAPTTRSGSNMSVTATYTSSSNGVSSSPKYQSTKDSTERRNSGPNNDNKSNEKPGNSGNNGAQPFNLAGTQQQLMGGTGLSFYISFIFPVTAHTVHEQRIRPGEFVMRVLFSEFTAAAEKKIELVMSEPTVSHFVKI